MDVVVANEHKDALYDLDIDIIKMISGMYSALEVGEMFSDFFFNRMIIDVTALKENDLPAFLQNVNASGISSREFGVLRHIFRALRRMNASPFSSRETP